MRRFSHSSPCRDPPERTSPDGCPSAHFGRHRRRLSDCGCPTVELRVYTRYAPHRSRLQPKSEHSLEAFTIEPNRRSCSPSSRARQTRRASATSYYTMQPASHTAHWPISERQCWWSTHSTSQPPKCGASASRFKTPSSPYPVTPDCDDSGSDSRSTRHLQIRVLRATLPRSHRTRTHVGLDANAQDRPRRSRSPLDRVHHATYSCPARRPQPSAYRNVLVK